MTQEPGKRIVTKEEYALARKRRQGLAFVGLALCIVAIACAGMVIVNSLDIIKLHLKVAAGGGTGWEGYGFLILGFMWVVFGIISCIAGWQAKKTMKEVAVTNPAMLFTIADLPAAESLVRASSEPLQAQQSVLLRAAIESTSEQEAELLRASAEGQE